MQIVGVLAPPLGERRGRSILYQDQNQPPAKDGTSDDVAYSVDPVSARTRTTLAINWVSSDYFDLFNDPAIAGRVFNPARTDRATVALASLPSRPRSACSRAARSEEHSSI